MTCTPNHHQVVSSDDVGENSLSNEIGVQILFDERSLNGAFLADLSLNQREVRRIYETYDRPRDLFNYFSATPVAQTPEAILIEAEEPEIQEKVRAVRKCYEYPRFLFILSEDISHWKDYLEEREIVEELQQIFNGDLASYFGVSDNLQFYKKCQGVQQTLWETFLQQASLPFQRETHITSIKLLIQQMVRKVYQTYERPRDLYNLFSNLGWPKELVLIDINHEPEIANKIIGVRKCYEIPHHSLILNERISEWRNYLEESEIIEEINKLQLNTVFNLDLKFSQPQTLLQIACLSTSHQALTALLAFPELDLNQRDENGRTALALVLPPICKLFNAAAQACCLLLLNDSRLDLNVPLIKEDFYSTPIWHLCRYVMLPKPRAGSSDGSMMSHFYPDIFKIINQFMMLPSINDRTSWNLVYREESLIHYFLRINLKTSLYSEFPNRRKACCAFVRILITAGCDPYKHEDAWGFRGIDHLIWWMYSPKKPFSRRLLDNLPSFDPEYPLRDVRQSMIFLPRAFGLEEDIPTPTREQYISYSLAADSQAMVLDQMENVGSHLWKSPEINLDVLLTGLHHPKYRELILKNFGELTDLMIIGLAQVMQYSFNSNEEMMHFISGPRYSSSTIQAFYKGLHPSRRDLFRELIYQKSLICLEQAQVWRNHKIHVWNLSLESSVEKDLGKELYLLLNEWDQLQKEVEIIDYFSKNLNIELKQSPIKEYEVLQKELRELIPILSHLPKYFDGMTEAFKEELKQALEQAKHLPNNHFEDLKNLQERELSLQHTLSKWLKLLSYFEENSENLRNDIQQKIKMISCLYETWSNQRKQLMVEESTPLKEYLEQDSVILLMDLTLKVQEGSSSKKPIKVFGDLFRINMEDLYKGYFLISGEDLAAIGIDNRVEYACDRLEGIKDYQSFEKFFNILVQSFLTRYKLLANVLRMRDKVTKEENQAFESAESIIAVVEKISPEVRMKFQQKQNFEVMKDQAFQEWVAALKHLNLQANVFLLKRFFAQDNLMDSLKVLLDGHASSLAEWKRQTNGMTTLNLYQTSGLVPSSSWPNKRKREEEVDSRQAAMFRRLDG